MGNATWRKLALLLIAAIIALLILLYYCCQSQSTQVGGIPPIIQGGSVICTVDTPIGQQKNRWCWAASMQMVSKFHCVDIEQCSLAEKYINLITNSTDPISNCCANYCILDGERGIEGNEPLQTFNGANQQYFDILFSKNGFNSIEDTISMKWDEVKRQINNCRPYIVVLKRNMANDKGELINTIHAVVVVNYLETASQNYVMLYDPWRPCEGCIELLPYPYLVWVERESTAGYESGIVETVHDIHLRTDTSCSSCGKTKIPSIDNAVALDRNKLSTLNNNSSSRILDSLRANPSNFVTPIRKISYNKIRKAFDLNNFDKVTENRKIYQITTTNQDKSAKYNVRVRNNRLEIEEVTYCDYFQTEPSLSLAVNNQVQNVKLSNRINAGGINYEYVEYEYLFYGFYRFTINNAVYLSPIQTYTNFYGQNEGIIQGKAYKESDILPVLQNKTIMDYKKINGFMKGEGDYKFNREK